MGHIPTKFSKMKDRPAVNTAGASKTMKYKPVIDERFNSTSIKTGKTLGRPEIASNNRTGIIRVSKVDNY